MYVYNELRFTTQINENKQQTALHVPEQWDCNYKQSRHVKLNVKEDGNLLGALIWDFPLKSRFTSVQQSKW